MTKEIITVKDLKVAYGDFVLFDDINFSVNEKDIFIIMGASGCGKSSMLPGSDRTGNAGQRRSAHRRKRLFGSRQPQ